MVILLLFLLWREVKPESILRLNYGVILFSEGYLDNAAQNWLHVFNIPVPELTSILPVSDLCENPTSKCQPFTKIINFIDSLHRELWSTWHNMVTDLNLLIPDASITQANLKRASSQKQSLTPSMDDPADKLRQVEKVLGSQSGKRDILETGEQEMVSHVMLQQLLDRTFVTAAQEIQRLSGSLDDAWNHAQDISVNVSLLLSDIALATWEAKQRMAGFWVGITSLASGQLSHAIVSPEQLRQTLDSIQSKLFQNYHGFQLADPSLEYYYSFSSVQAVKRENFITVIMSVPVTSYVRQFALFKSRVFPLSYDNKTHHATIIENIPNYIAVARDNSGYIELEDEDIIDCKGFNTRVCYTLKATRKRNSPSCIKALYDDNFSTIKAHCKYKFLASGLQASLTELTPGLVLLTNISSYIMQCKTRSLSQTGCKHCLITLPCQCTLYAHNMELPQRVRSCTNESAPKGSSLPIYPANMGFVVRVLDKSSLDSVDGSQLFQQNLNYQVPLVHLLSSPHSQPVWDNPATDINLDEVVSQVRSNQTLLVKPQDTAGGKNDTTVLDYIVMFSLIFMVLILVGLGLSMVVLRRMEIKACKLLKSHTQQKRI